ncbi:hypothetical protein [Streptomyces lunaelactis]|uniref:hypothetical protein n=1 Tax=Streptomyces lunaelactis TaxID=1535768 RepID=UPI0015858B84|nr:hypothetical protein [Streptomyces lunaelactis]NUK22045.1 hypothetical protein [Streptomyces lunaelactis]
MTEPRLTVDTITSDQLDALYDQLDRRREQVYAEREQMRASFREQDAENAHLRAERDTAQAAIERVRDALNSLCADPHPGHDHVCPDDVRAAVRAALDEPKESDAVRRLKQAGFADPANSWDIAEPYDECRCSSTNAGLELCARCPGNPPKEPTK